MSNEATEVRTMREKSEWKKCKMLLTRKDEESLEKKMNEEVIQEITKYFF